MHANFALIAATYIDVAQADSDYRRLAQWFNDRERCAELDAVIVARKASGESRFHRERSLSGATADGGALGLAAGLAAALFPSVGADIPSSQAGDRAALQAVAGVISTVLSRSDQMKVGAHLDPASAALIIAASMPIAGELRDELVRAGSTLEASVHLDEATVERFVQVARRLS